MKTNPSANAFDNGAFQGLSNRAYIASECMKGLLSSPNGNKFTADAETSAPLRTWKDYAAAAVQAADALIEELNKATSKL